MDGMERCPRCDKDVEPKHREWKAGPDGRYCPDCGCPLHEVSIGPQATDTDR